MSSAWHPTRCLLGEEKAPQARGQRTGTGACKAHLWLPSTHSPTTEHAPSSSNCRIQSPSLSRQGSRGMQQPLTYLSPSKLMIGSLYCSSTNATLSTTAPTFSSTSRSGNSSCKLLISCLMRPSCSWVSAGDGDRLVL